MDENPYKSPNAESDQELRPTYEADDSPRLSPVLAAGSLAVVIACVMLACRFYTEGVELLLFFAVNGTAWAGTAILVLANLRRFLLVSLLANLLAFLSAFALMPR